MNKIEQQISRFKKLDIDEIFRESVIETKEFLRIAIRDQMLAGKNSEGDVLGYYAWIDYAEFKQTFTHGQTAPFGVYDFNLTGEFHDAMYIEFDLYGNILIDSTDNKTGYLTNLVSEFSGGNGEQLTFGLMDSKLGEYSKLTYHIIIKKIRQQLGY